MPQVVAFTCRFTLLAPDLLRTDSHENIYLQAYDVSNPVVVSISILDFSKTSTLLQDSVTLSVENGFHALKSIQVTHQGCLCFGYMPKVGSQISLLPLTPFCYLLILSGLLIKDAAPLLLALLD